MLAMLAHDLSLLCSVGTPVLLYAWHTQGTELTAANGLDYRSFVGTPVPYAWHTSER